MSGGDFQLIWGSILSAAPGIVLAAVLYALTFRLRERRIVGRGLSSSGGREIVMMLFWMYCGGMVGVVFLPREFHWLDVLRYGYEGTFFQQGTVNFTILKSLRYSHLIFWGNIVAFLPVGFCPAVLWRKMRWYKAAAIALGVTALIESWQFFIGRAFDVDDLMLNALGGMAGWCLWMILRKPRLWCRGI